MDFPGTLWKDWHDVLKEITGRDVPACQSLEAGGNVFLLIIRITCK